MVKIAVVHDNSLDTDKTSYTISTVQLTRALRLLTSLFEAYCYAITWPVACISFILGIAESSSSMATAFSAFVVALLIKSRTFSPMTLLTLTLVNFRMAYISL